MERDNIVAVHSFIVLYKATIIDLEKTAKSTQTHPVGALVFRSRLRIG